ncbi:hypothetical protein Lser_V15G35725 [Lactuca serriola]
MEDQDPDPESEWAIQEYSPSKEGETTMVKWILNKGYSIGKKMVVTGIVMSSAPLVLPPLLVFSAMGVAFSVPFGLVYASYACTNTLMNKLFPTPASVSPLLLEYYPDEEEVDSKFDLHEGGDDYTNENEEGELRKENMTQEEEEARIWETEEGTESPNGCEQEVEALATNVDGDVDEKGYYIDDEAKGEDGPENVVQVEYHDLMEENEDEKEREDEDDVLQREYDIEVEEREQMEDINEGSEMADDEHKQTQEVSTTNSSGEDEQGYEEDDGEYLEGTDDSLQEERNKEEVNKDETEEIVKGSTGLLENLRDEGTIDGHESSASSNEVFEENKDDVEMIEPQLVIVKEIESQKLVKDGSKNEEMHRVVILSEGNEENNFNSREVEELDLVAREVVGDTRKEASDAKATKENMKKTSNDGSEDAMLKTNKEHLVHSDEDAREIGDESGLDLFDKRNTSIDFEILEGGDELKKNTVDDNEDVMSLPGFRHAPLDSDNVKVASKTDRKTPSREDVLEDEKIWEKIGAMRAIVGYKAPSEATFMEELKALYVFTGVEPPASFKGDSNSDRDEVNAKLKFLMSIVGVK